jgi:hypothetical protein
LGDKGVVMKAFLLFLAKVAAWAVIAGLTIATGVGMAWQ